jgi:hypothetical protein
MKELCFWDLSGLQFCFVFVLCGIVAIDAGGGVKLVDDENK